MKRGRVFSSRASSPQRRISHPACIPRKAALGLWLYLAIFLAAGTAPAQTVGKVSGVVRDAETREPLIGCNVTIVGTNLGAATNEEGAYFILNVPPGKYDFQASMMGYQKMVQRGAVVNAGRTTTADFSLAPTTLEQKEIVVEAARPDVEREKTSTSAIIRFDDVQQMAGIRDVGDVLGLAADVTDGHFRGGRTGEEYYTLQGMGITNPLDNTSAFLPIMSSVEEVEVITSGFGAQYGNAQSGVVNITMKEGKSDKWRSRVETRMRAPGRKHFGPSVFDPSANRYLQMLLNTSTWRYGDPNAENPQPYYGRFVPAGLFSGDRDTTVRVAMAQALWLQTRRGLNQNYGNNVDYSVEAATGGPLNDNMRMFMALRSNNVWPVFPTEQPDMERQVMGNVVFDVSGNSTLRISGGYTQERTNDFPSDNSVSGYQRWLWDRITGIDYDLNTNVELGARFTQTVSPSTFYELKINSLFIRTKQGATPYPSSLSDSAIVGSNPILWSTGVLSIAGGNSPDGINALVGNDDFKNEYTRTISFDGSLTSQVSESHLLNFGLQFNSYLIDVADMTDLRNSQYLDRYRSKPFEGAAYVQDKMEFEGLIANVGLRFDFWSENQDYYTNLFSPYQVIGDSGTVNNHDPDHASKAKAPTVGRLQPRIGISFPVSTSTVFHLNYGSFMQRPSFQYVVRVRNTQVPVTAKILGNPRLEPETTNSYDIGVMQGLGQGFTLDVSGYYKDVKNLTQQADYYVSGVGVSSFFNLDYADIRGFRIALEKRRGAFTGSINYQYSVATGKSATATNAVPRFTLDPQTGAVSADYSTNAVPVRDILLDFDRTHNLILNLAYTSEDEWGPMTFGFHPFENLTLSTTSFFRSGRPYTSPSNTKLINGARAPGEYNTNARLTKRILNFFGSSASFYVEVFNLFDQKILNYDYVFPTWTPTSQNLQTQYYEMYPIDNVNHGIRYYWDVGRQGSFTADQSFLIYSNMPRSFNFGIVLDL